MHIFFQSQTCCLWPLPRWLHCCLFGDCLLRNPGLFVHSYIITTDAANTPPHLQMKKQTCQVCFFSFTEFWLSLHKTESGSEIQAPVNTARLLQDCEHWGHLQDALKSAHVALFSTPGVQNIKAVQHEFSHKDRYASSIKYVFALKCVLVSWYLYLSIYIKSMIWEKKRKEKSFALCQSRVHKPRFGSDLRTREGDSCHIITMIPHVLCSPSADMDLTGLHTAVKRRPTTAVDEQPVPVTDNSVRALETQRHPTALGELLMLMWRADSE